MSKALIERLRRARQTVVPSLGRSFTVRRPTDLEMHEMQGKVDQRLLLTRFVTDWGEMTEIDLDIPGGGPAPVPFDAELWAEWIADHTEHWDTITSAVVGAYKVHRAAMEDVAKNSTPGSAS